MLTRTKSLLAVAFALGALLFAAGPAAAQYEPGGEITVDDSTVVAGQSVNVSGRGCQPNETVTFTFNGQPGFSLAQGQ